MYIEKMLGNYFAGHTVQFNNFNDLFVLDIEIYIESGTETLSRSEGD